MHSHVQLITTPTADTAGTAMLLDVGKKRYLFGSIHEGLQRACVQRKSRLAKTTEIFITGKTEWKNIGGLFGVILTLADANASAAQSEKENVEKRKKKTDENPQSIAAKAERKAKYVAGKAKVFREAGLDPEEWVGSREKSAQVPSSMPTLKIHGGKNLTHTIATGRRFIFRKGMPIEIDEHVQTRGFPSADASADDGRDPDWTDHFIQVWKLPIEPADKDGSRESPRKRSFAEFAAGTPIPPHPEDAPRDDLSTLEHPQARDDEQRKFVVSEMFDSQWRLDALTETPLVTVPMGTYMWIRNEKTNKLERYYRPRDGPLPQMNVLIRRPWPGALVEELPPTKPSQTAMSYIIRHYTRRGKFNHGKAKALNVHPMIFQALQRGATVKSQDGLTVTPDMVLEPSRPGGGFAVVDLPSKDYISDLLGRPEWKMPRIMDGLQAIFWNLGPDVAGTSALQSFFSQHQTIKHIVMAPEISANNISFDSSAALVTRLNQFDGQRYFIPIYSDSLHLDALTKRLIDADYPMPLTPTRGFQLQLEPFLQFQEQANDDLFLGTAAVLKTMPAEVLELAQNVKSEITPGRSTETLVGQDLPSEDAEIICLGTGSSAPSKYRNVSATLLRVPGCGSYLFDCGEGTLGQLRRLYTPPELEGLFRDLKAVWISHLHADHHLGTTSVIKAWYEANYGLSTAQADRDRIYDRSRSPIDELEQGKRLFLFSEYQMIRWLKEYSSVEDFGYEKLMAVRTHSAKKLDPNFSEMDWDGAEVGFCTDNVAINEAMKQATGMTNLITCRVNHCVDAQAISVTFPTGFKFSYSGDCRPSGRFVRIGHGSTVLVHEATFEDDMEGDAEAKKHSTTSEAIGVARAMGAKRLILTHFSQRYQKIPQLGALDTEDVNFDDVETASSGGEELDVPDDPELIGSAINFGHHPSLQRKPTPPPTYPTNRKYENLKIAIAFDFLRVRVGDIAYLERLTPTLQRMFELLGEDDKAKTKDDPSEIAPGQKLDGKARTNEESEKKTSKNKEAEEKEKEEMIRPPQEERKRTGESKGNIGGAMAKAEDAEAIPAEDAGAGSVKQGYGSDTVQVQADGRVGPHVGLGGSDGEKTPPLPLAEVQQASLASATPD